MDKIIITVVGKDTIGIIAKVCIYLSENQINILDISQTILDDMFNMMVIADMSRCPKEFGIISDELKALGEEYLNNLQYDTVTIEATAADLHKINPSIGAFRLLTRYRVISELHGIDHYFPLTKLEIKLDNPEESIVTLGGVVKAKTLTKATSALPADITKKAETAQNNAVRMVTGS